MRNDDRQKSTEARAFAATINYSATLFEDSPSENRTIEHGDRDHEDQNSSQSCGSSRASERAIISPSTVSIELIIARHASGAFSSLTERASPDRSIISPGTINLARRTDAGPPSRGQRRSILESGHPLSRELPREIEISDRSSKRPREPVKA